MRDGHSIPVLISGVAIVAGLSFAVLDPTVALISTALGCAMLSIAVIDAQRFLIPDVISLPALVGGLIATSFLAESHTVGASVLAHIGAAALGGGILYALATTYKYLRKRDGLGFGDVKLAAVAGAWTGPEGLAQVLLLACLAALVFVVVVYRRDLSSLQKTTLIPFGAFLAPFIWLVWFGGEAGFEIALSRH